VHLAALQQATDRRQAHAVAQVRRDEAALGSARLPMLAPRPAVGDAKRNDDRHHHGVEVTRRPDLRRPEPQLPRDPLLRDTVA
jgi:hypothetical protein